MPEKVISSSWNFSDRVSNPAFQLKDKFEPSLDLESEIHVLGPGIVCDTERRGHATPQGRSPLEIVVDASEGFIPLWASEMTLKWRFRHRSMSEFENPDAAKNEIRMLFGEALLAWGTAAPIKFTEDEDLWDFEIVVRQGDDCSPGGCVLASAFFPDTGRHEFVVYPKMFTQNRKEQVDTFIHEIGHIFGLRHFFANISETRWASEIFGKHSQFSIMNYGSLSELTDDDKDDLAKLYRLAWTGGLTNINGTPIRLVKPFNTLASASPGVFAMKQMAVAFQAEPTLAYIAGI
jgi:hypothetical protein